MRSCEWIRHHLDDYADGETPAEEARNIESHLESCQACSAEWEALRSLLHDASTLPRRIEPPRDLWSEISPRLHRTPLSFIDWQRHRRTAVFAAGIAAMAVIAASLGLLQQQPIPEQPPVQVIAAHARPEPLQADRSVLREAYNVRADDLDPELRSVIDSNLSIIDESLDEIRRAMELSPDNPRLEQLLMTACLSEVGMLRQAIQRGRES